MQTEDDLRTGMYKVLEHLRDHEDAWPFHDPVEEEYAPNYYAVIRRPMHITRVSFSLQSIYVCVVVGVDVVVVVVVVVVRAITVQATDINWVIKLPKIQLIQERQLLENED